MKDVFYERTLNNAFWMNRNFVVPLCVVFRSAAACLLARTNVSLLLIFFGAFFDNEIFEGMNFKAAIISTTSSIFSNHIFVDWYWFCVDYYFNQYSDAFVRFAKVFVCLNFVKTFTTKYRKEQVSYCITVFSLSTAYFHHFDFDSDDIIQISCF